MALKEFKGRMLPSAPSSTLTVTSSMPLQCGSFSCNTVRILVLPSGSVLLLMLATDFDLEMVENDCLRNSVLFGVHGGLHFLHGGCLYFLHGGHLNGLERRLTPCCRHFWSPGCFETWTADMAYLCPCILWMCCGIFCPLLLTVWTYIEY